MKELLSSLLLALLIVSDFDVSAGQQDTGNPIRKTRDVVSVHDFGARGNDVTNDAAAIQAAIDSLGARGGKF